MPYWSDLARELRRRLPGMREAIFVGPKEVWLGVRVHEESGKLHPVLGPDLDLAGLAAAMAELDLLVTNDSGPMHLAAAVGVPCVALFGPTDRRRTAPAGESGAGHTVLDRNLWCSPCFRRRCPLLHPSPRPTQRSSRRIGLAICRRHGRREPAQDGARDLADADATQAAVVEERAGAAREKRSRHLPAAPDRGSRGPHGRAPPGRSSGSRCGA